MMCKGFCCKIFFVCYGSCVQSVIMRVAG